MAEYTINHKCGHTGILIKFGSIRLALAKAKSLEVNVCEGCRKAKVYGDAIATLQAKRGDLSGPELLDVDQEIGRLAKQASE